MPAFSGAAIPDATLYDLASYVHESLAHPTDEAAQLGPRALDPFWVGVVVWVALALLAGGVAALFGEGRH